MISTGFDPEQDVLVVVSKSLAENVDPAGALGVVLDADADAD